MGSIFRKKYKTKKKDGTVEVKQGSIVWIKYQHEGIVYRESSKSKKESVAKRLLKFREGQIQSSKFAGLKIEKIRFNELAKDLDDDYVINAKKSLARMRRSVRNLMSFFDSMKVISISTTLINDYIKKRQKQGFANATINRELSALKRMFSLGYQMTPPKVLRKPYIPHLTENNVRTGFFEDEHYQLFRDALTDYFRPVFILGYYFGMRIQEILNLKWTQVNIFEKKITLEAGTTKNNESRIIYLEEEEYDAIRKQLSIRDKHFPNCPYVFFNSKGEPIGDFRPLWDKAIFKCGWSIKYKCKDCGEHTSITEQKQLEDLTCKNCGCDERKKLRRDDKIFHDLRRTAVRNMTRSGVPDTVAMAISGHKTRSVFDRYNIVNENDLREAPKKVHSYHNQTRMERKKIKKIKTGTN